jgi:hypothetical protein
MFDYVHYEIIKNIGYSNMDKNKLSKVRMCVWVCFKRCKLILDDHKIILDMDDEKNIFEEY